MGGNSYNPGGKPAVSPNERALIMAMVEKNGGNCAATARELKTLGFDFSADTVERTKNGKYKSLNPEYQRKLNQEVTEFIGGMYQEIVEKLLAILLQRIKDGKVENASLSQLMMAVGIATDKMNLLSNRPTSITQNLTREQRMSRIEELTSRLAQADERILDASDAEPETVELRLER